MAGLEAGQLGGGGGGGLDLLGVRLHALVRAKFSHTHFYMYCSNSYHWDCITGVTQIACSSNMM